MFRTDGSDCEQPVSLRRKIIKVCRIKMGMRRSCAGCKLYCVEGWLQCPSGSGGSGDSVDQLDISWRSHSARETAGILSTLGGV